MSEVDLVWLAGLLEGEGTFDLQRGKYPRIRLTMTDRDIVGRAASLLDSTLRLTYAREHKPLWSAEKQGPRAAEVMEAILPHMGARRSHQIATVLSRHRSRALGDSAPETFAAGFSVSRPPGLGDPLTAASVAIPSLTNNER